MNTILQRVEKLQQELDALLPIKHEFQKQLDKKFRLEFNYNSNHLEGSTLTYQQTELVLLFDLIGGNNTLREYEEMKAHDLALELVKDLASTPERPLTESFIRELNKKMLVRPFFKEAITPDGQSVRREISIGEYKQFPNSVRLENGEIFEYTSPTDTPIQMGELIQWFRDAEQNKELHPVEIAGLLHYRFVRIHPFDDGNGRISRLLMNYVLYKHGLPPIVIKSADKNAYLSALHRADRGDIGAFIEYLYEQFIWSLELSIRAAKGEGTEEPDDYEKEIALWKRQVKANVGELERRNNTLVYNLYIHSVKPLFETLGEKLTNNFQDVFHDIKTSTYMNGSSASKSIEWLTDEMTKDYTEKPTEDTITNNSLSVALDEYKYNPSRPFSLQSEIKVIFDVRQYQIVFSGKYIEKKYGEYLTDEEKKEIIVHCVKNIFDKIKQKSGDEIS